MKTENDEVEKEDLDCDSSFFLNRILKDAGKQVLKAIKWFLITLLLFGGLNSTFFIIAIYKNANSDLIKNSSLFSILILVIGIAIIILALYFTYRYILIDGLSVIYKYLRSFFEKVCVMIVDKVVAGGGRLLGNRDLNKSLSVSSLMLEIYGHRMPYYVREGVVFILRRVPFSDFLFKMQEDLSQKKDNKVLSKILYDQLDNYIQKEIFWKNNMKWILWLLPLNLIIQVFLLIWMGK